MRSLVSLLIFVFLSAALACSCQREERRFSESPEASRMQPAPPSAAADRQKLARYSEQAWAMSEGQRLYSQMNCAGCHGRGGGGGMAPPLMDAKWRYGSAPEDLERTILAGAPRGMPSFKDKLSPQQVWQLVAYVRSLSGQAPSTAAPVRDDHMAVRTPPSRTEPEPVQQEIE